MFDDGYSIYEIAKACGITSRTSLNNVRNKENIESLTLETVKKLQEFINQEEKKMNVNDIKNVDYIWVFDDLGEFLDSRDNFKNHDDFEWWEKLADALAYMEEEQEIDTNELEINELQDYVDIAEEHGFEA